jgi:hypothetical protein
MFLGGSSTQKQTISIWFSKQNSDEIPEHDTFPQIFNLIFQIIKVHTYKARYCIHPYKLSTVTEVPYKIYVNNSI